MQDGDFDVVRMTGRFVEIVGYNCRPMKALPACLVFLGACLSLPAFGDDSLQQSSVLPELPTKRKCCCGADRF